MSKKKKIPCRVCGKLFEPCSYCQSHIDTFRWRNFACSIECAKKYISETIAYRNLSKQNKNNGIVENIHETENHANNNNVTKKRNYRKKSVNSVENMNEERESRLIRE